MGAQWALRSRAIDVVTDAVRTRISDSDTISLVDIAKLVVRIPRLRLPRTVYDRGKPSVNHGPVARSLASCTHRTVVTFVFGTFSRHPRVSRGPIVAGPVHIALYPELGRIVELSLAHANTLKWNLVPRTRYALCGVGVLDFAVRTCLAVRRAGLVCVAPNWAWLTLTVQAVLADRAILAGRRIGTVALLASGTKLAAIPRVARNFRFLAFQAPTRLWISVVIWPASNTLIRLLPCANVAAGATVLRIGFSITRRAQPPLSVGLLLHA